MSLFSKILTQTLIYMYYASISITCTCMVHAMCTYNFSQDFGLCVQLAFEFKFRVFLTISHVQNMYMYVCIHTCTVGTVHLVDD